MRSSGFARPARRCCPSRSPRPNWSAPSMPSARRRSRCETGTGERASEKRLTAESAERAENLFTKTLNCRVGDALLGRPERDGQDRPLLFALLRGGVVRFLLPGAAQHSAERVVAFVARIFVEVLVRRVPRILAGP